MRMLVVPVVVQLCFSTSQSLCLKFLDQELISYRYSLLLFFLLGHLFEKPRAPIHRFKSYRDEIWQERSSGIYASIDGVGFPI